MAQELARRVVVVTVGDELVSGRTRDTNAGWLAAELTQRGFDVVELRTVGDGRGHLTSCLHEVRARTQAVVVTGGLGPTEDDRTRASLAAVASVPLRTDARVRDALEARFRSAGFARMPESNLRQAELPEGAQPLPNDLGSAPGIAMVVDGVLFLALPGVPAEMRSMFLGEALPLLEDHLGPGEPRARRVIHTSGIAESELADRIERAKPDTPVGVSYLPDLRGVRIVLEVTGARGEEARSLLDREVEALGGAWAGHEIADAEGDIVAVIASQLVRSGWRLAVAESCTGGLVGKRITDRPGASRYFVGGVLAYENAVKTEWLGVPEALIDRHGAVSGEVAEAMAEGVGRAFSVEASLAVTGVAGPTGGTPEKPVGTVWYAARVRDQSLLESRVFPGGREAVRERSAQAALRLLSRALDRASG